MAAAYLPDFGVSNRWEPKLGCEFPVANCRPEYKLSRSLRGLVACAGINTLKFLILIIICSVIPIFFGFVFLHGTKNRLASLRERCRTAPDPSRAAAEYEAVRTAFPSSLVARWFGFGPLDLGGHKNPSNSPQGS